MNTRHLLAKGLHKAASACVPCLVIAGLVCIASRPATADSHRRRIYFLESLDPTLPAAVRTMQAFKTRMGEKTSESFDIFMDFMELERLPGQAHIDSTVHFLAEKYAEAPPDILIPLGRAAIPFTVKYRDLIAPGVPTIMADVPARAVPDGKGLADTLWVATQYNFTKTLELAQQLQPSARNLVFIAGASDYDATWLNDARQELAPQLGRYTTRYIVGRPYDDMLRDVSQLPPDTIVIMLSVFVDGAGFSHVPPEVAAAVASASSAPVYSPISTFFGRGIVGGYMDSFEAHGVAAADLALEILSGKPVATVQQQTEPLHQYVVDARQLERWGFSTKDLPPDAVVSYRQSTLWEEHGNLLLAAAAVFALQTTLLGILLIQRRQRKRAEAEAAEQRREVAHLMRVSALGELSGAIAHEVSQPLGAILMNAEAALRFLEQNSPDLAEAREAIGEIVHEDRRAGQVIMRLRNLLKKGDKKSEPVDLNDLMKSTITLLRHETISRGMVVQIDLADGLPAASGDPVQLQQVLINLLMNAMDAMMSTPEAQRRITVRTHETQAGGIEVEIRDRGAGIRAGDEAKLFKPFHTTKEHGLGLGLSISSSIARAHGGRLTLANHESGGAVAILALPALEALAAAAQ
jgi:signal transduction histidine kinase